MFRASRISREVKLHDKDLYCIRGESHYVIMRKAYKPYLYEVDGMTMACFQRRDEPVFHLTSNWNVSGAPIDWGIEPIMKHLRRIDSRNTGAFIWEKDQINEKLEKSQDRAQTNMFESLAHEVRPIYKKLREEMNLSSVNKSDVSIMKKHEAKFKRKGL